MFYNMFLLSLAKFLSGFAGYIYDIGIVIYLFSQTKSVAAIGGFFISQFLPALIILFTGKLIDTHNQKMLMFLSNLAKAAVFFLLLFEANIVFIYVATFFMNLLLEFESNTTQALMANLFQKAIYLRQLQLSTFWTRHLLFLHLSVRLSLQPISVFRLI